MVYMTFSHRSLPWMEVGVGTSRWELKQRPQRTLAPCGTDHSGLLPPTINHYWGKASQACPLASLVEAFFSVTVSSPQMMYVWPSQHNGPLVLYPNTPLLSQHSPSFLSPRSQCHNIKQYNFKSPAIFKIVKHFEISSSLKYTKPLNCGLPYNEIYIICVFLFQRKEPGHTSNQIKAIPTSINTSFHVGCLELTHGLLVPEGLMHIHNCWSCWVRH